MDIYEARNLLPRVGDRRKEVPTVYKTTAAFGVIDKAQECVVIEVNRANLWYRVQFANGFRECYKVPKLKPSSQGGIL